MFLLLYYHRVHLYIGRYIWITKYLNRILLSPWLEKEIKWALEISLVTSCQDLRIVHDKKLRRSESQFKVQLFQILYTCVRTTDKHPVFISISVCAIIHNSFAIVMKVNVITFLFCFLLADSDHYVRVFRIYAQVVGHMRVHRIFGK